jgi:hypothetical protein
MREYLAVARERGGRICLVLGADVTISKEAGHNETLPFV